ncbi:MAG: alpha-ketoglutarate-dependent dioxygenase AlkB, partial [Nocardia sp.]|nr:alpha-ketoglutarate-dependent dioxygenase AlkB [Nocardia sp.]
MSTPLQHSLLDGFDGIALGPLTGIRRTNLTAGAWVDLLPGWLRGADELFGVLAAQVPWRSDRRPMYDRVVDVPRLQHHYGVDEPWPDPILEHARAALSDHYAEELGEPFTTAGLCYYRDGRDRVAW